MAKKHYIPVTADVPGAANERNCALIRRVIRTALQAEGVDVPCEVDVLLTGDEGIRRINRDMRQVDRPTDVLSFPEFTLRPGERPEAEDADPGTGLVPLGDMVISMERVAAQAKEYGHPNRRELSYLVVHSVLHLLGYDHLDEGPQKRQMRTREEAILSELGIGRTEGDGAGEH
ncbi:rRNA maturation RNase YbeY [uncultured Oscillibacter sp.]|uniref:rRNA maturation RNase YbeY n=1 Tax=uncultured Oscillibacter sp. TaxID=876091 RepID=UPI0025D5168E|nr:rRNA maturation RNase YbeY [uncultured Oscillibacter sp.]